MYYSQTVQELEMFQWGHNLSVMDTRGLIFKAFDTFRVVSMGPQPIGHGYRRIASTCLRSCPGFNGATTYRSWIQDDMKKFVIAIDVNGGAIMYLEGGSTA